MNPLQRQLYAFAAHLRDPASHPAPPVVEDRRMAVYRDLVVRNLDALLAANFPVIRRTLGTAQWEALVRGFLAGHRCRTPLFPEIAQEFIGFLQQRAGEGAGDPGWLAELAHYEWVELALQIADDAPPAHDPHGDLLTGAPLLSPLAWPLAYAWPVHRIGPDHRPDAPASTPALLLARRDSGGAVRFAELSPLVYRLLVLLDEDSARSGQDALAQLAGEAGAADRVRFLEEGAAMLRRLHQEGTLLGTRR